MARAICAIRARRFAKKRTPGGRRPLSMSRARTMGLRSARDHDLVDDVDDAVRLDDVWDGDARDVALRVDDGDMRLAAVLECEWLALNRIERELAARLIDLASDILGGIAAGDDMIGQDRRQLALVRRLQQRLDRALGQRGEGFVG